MVLDRLSIHPVRLTIYRREYFGKSPVQDFLDRTGRGGSAGSASERAVAAAVGHVRSRPWRQWRVSLGAEPIQEPLPANLAGMLNPRGGTSQHDVAWRWIECTGGQGVLLRPGPREGRRTWRGGVLTRWTTGGRGRFADRCPVSSGHYRPGSLGPVLPVPLWTDGYIAGGEAALFADQLPAFQHLLRHRPDVMLELSGRCRDRLALPSRTCA
jgi:hypothetical protein